MDALARFLFAAVIQRFLRPFAERNADDTTGNPSARKTCPNCKFSAKLPGRRCPGCLRPFEEAA